MPRLCKCTKASETSTKIDAACKPAMGVSSCFLSSIGCRKRFNMIQPLTVQTLYTFVYQVCFVLAVWPPRVPNNAARGSCCRGSRQEPLSFLVILVRLIQRSARNEIYIYTVYRYVIMRVCIMYISVIHIGILQ